MSHRIREVQGLLTAIADAIVQLETLCAQATNTGWGHDHVAVLNHTVVLLKKIRIAPSNQSLRKDLGRLVGDNDGADFPQNLESLLLEISTANIRT